DGLVPGAVIEIIDPIWSFHQAGNLAAAWPLRVFYRIVARVENRLGPAGEMEAILALRQTQAHGTWTAAEAGVPTLRVLGVIDEAELAIPDHRGGSHYRARLPSHWLLPDGAGEPRTETGSQDRIGRVLFDERTDHPVLVQRGLRQRLVRRLHLYSPTRLLPVAVA